MNAIQLQALEDVSKSLQWLSSVIEESDNKTAKRVTESARLVLDHVLMTEQRNNVSDHGRQLTLDL